MTFVVVGSLATAISLLLLLKSMLNDTALKLVLGYRWVIDIILTAGLTVASLFSGTVSGLVISAMGGLTITLLLMLAKEIIGYAKIERVNGKLRIVKYEPKWKLESITKYLPKGAVA